jgi:hypothetical protein
MGEIKDECKIAYCHTLWVGDGVEIGEFRTSEILHVQTLYILDGILLALLTLHVLLKIR